MRVEPVTEERATRCLQRLNLLTVVREEVGFESDSIDQCFASIQSQVSVM